MFYKNENSIHKTFIKYFTLFFVFFAFHSYVYADTTTSTADLQSKIDATTAQKAELEKEIEGYESQLKDIGVQATSLASAVKQLDATINKNGLQIQLTQNEIKTTNLQIQSLSLQIGKNTDAINQDSVAIANLIVQTNQTDDSTVIENLLAYNNISEVWNEIENISELQNQLSEKVNETKDAKTTLENNKAATEQKKKDLTTLAASLLDQKKVLQVSEAAKTTLLAQTKDKESNYEAILAQKKAESLSLDQELANFESNLKFKINPTQYPAAGSAVLHWPLDVIRITQPFGITAFSQTTTAYNALLGHNGVDFGAPIGTPIHAALDGIVAGTGNTDTVCPGASFGQWVFIQHANGLSTMYAHLSLIKVIKGQSVSTGDIIGYTGLTGYTTGPHLHFGVYVTAGSEITSYKSKVCAGTYTMPVAELQAYLDPMQYLP